MERLKEEIDLVIASIEEIYNDHLGLPVDKCPMVETTKMTCVDAVTRLQEIKETINIQQNFNAIRKEVKVFSLSMERKLSQNDHKMGWQKCEDVELLKKLNIELEELIYALENESTKSIIDECADVANFAMMIADKRSNDA